MGFKLAFAKVSSENDKTYVYTVSGAGTSEVNGDYWDSGETTYTNNDDKTETVPVYINDKGSKLYYNTDNLMWVLESENDPGNILYDGAGQYDKVVGTYRDFNAGDGTSPVVAEYNRM